MVMAFSYPKTGVSTCIQKEHLPATLLKLVSMCSQGIFLLPSGDDEHALLPDALLNSTDMHKPHTGCSVFTWPWWQRGLTFLSSKGL